MPPECEDRGLTVLGEAQGGEGGVRPFLTGRFNGGARPDSCCDGALLGVNLPLIVGRVG